MYSIPLCLLPIIGTHPGESTSEPESMYKYRDASLVPCLIRVVLTQFCSSSFCLLPFAFYQLVSETSSCSTTSTSNNCN